MLVRWDLDKSHDCDRFGTLCCRRDKRSRAFLIDGEASAAWDVASLGCCFSETDQGWAVDRQCGESGMIGPSPLPLRTRAWVFFDFASFPSSLLPSWKRHRKTRQEATRERLYQRRLSSTLGFLRLHPLRLLPGLYIDQYFTRTISELSSLECRRVPCTTPQFDRNSALEAWPALTWRICTLLQRAARLCGANPVFDDASICMQSAFFSEPEAKSFRSWPA